MQQPAVALHCPSEVHPRDSCTVPAVCRHGEEILPEQESENHARCAWPFEGVGCRHGCQRRPGARTSCMVTARIAIQSPFLRPRHRTPVSQRARTTTACIPLMVPSAHPCHMDHMPIPPSPRSRYAPVFTASPPAHVPVLTVHTIRIPHTHPTPCIQTGLHF